MKRQFVEQYATLEQWHWWFRGRQRILETILRRELKGGPAMKIASLGCGPAEGLLWLNEFIENDGRIIGVDAESLHARQIPPNIKYVVGNIESLPLVEKSFDAVLVLDVLEHLDDDAAGLREAASLLKPGGLLLVTVPALPSLWGGQDVISHHRRRYVKHTLCDVFIRAGLPIPRTAYFNSLLFFPIAGVRWARRALGLGKRARSDFEDSQPGLFNELLAGLFAVEQHLITRVQLPVGVSLLATLHTASIS